MPKNQSTEDIVIITVMLIGFVGGVIICLLDILPIITAVFLATGIASLVYRFLGGIQSTTFNIGPVKLVGSIAALIGCAWFINNNMVEQIKTKNQNMIEQRESEKKHLEFKPDKSQWVAMDINKCIPVTVKVETDELNYLTYEPKQDIFKNTQLDIDREFKIMPEDSKNGFILGKLSVKDLKSINLFNSIKENANHFTITTYLYSNEEADDLFLGNLRLKTKKICCDWTYYSLLDGDVEYPGEIKQKGYQIHHIKQKYYFVAILALNHTLGEKEGDEVVDKSDRKDKAPEFNWAKFAIGEIDTDCLPSTDL